MPSILAVIAVIAGIFGLPLLTQRTISPCGAFVSELVRGSSEMAAPSSDVIEKGTPIMVASMASQHPYIPPAISCTVLYWDMWANPKQVGEHTLDYLRTMPVQP
jgi:hypothetical protein